MDREKLLQEHKATLESLIEKNKFVYSEEFNKLDEFEKQKYQKDKMATESHLSTLSNLLWGAKMQFGGGLTDMFALGLLGSMFGGGWGSTTSPSIDYLQKQVEKDAQEIKEAETEKEGV